MGLTKYLQYTNFDANDDARKYLTTFAHVARSQPLNSEWVKLITYLDYVADNASGGGGGDYDEEIQELQNRATALEAEDVVINERIDGIHGIDYYEESFSITELHNSFIAGKPVYLAGIYDETTEQYYNGIVVRIFKTAGQAKGKVWIITCDTSAADPIPKTAMLTFTDDSAYTVEFSPSGQADFLLYDFNQAVSTTLTPVTSDTAIDSAHGRIDVNLPADMTDMWKIASVAKYEVKNGTTRIDAIRCYEFSLNQQSTMRLGFRTSGTTDKTVDSISGALLLTRR